MSLGRSRWPVLAVVLLVAHGIPLRGAAVKPMVDARAIPPDQGAPAVWQALQRLHTRASVLMIVAHPDDEDGATLSFESRSVGARVDLLTLDRGEGGANVMSADYWDALGLVRTEELLQADRYYGVDQQFFTTLADYGFSKSLDEALKQWGHDRVLEQAVRVVRTVRPLVVCSVFVGGPTDGHGQHAVAGLMAQEVFNAAGDPKMFPEQIREGLLPWSPAKTYARVPFFRTSEKGMYDYANHTWGPVGVTNHVTGKWEPGKPSVTVNIPNGTFDPISGQGFQQISREGLGYQSSQNGGPDVPLPGMQVSMYHRFGTHVEAKLEETGFFDGLDVSLVGIGGLAGTDAPATLREGLQRVNGLVEKAMADFRPQHPEAIAPQLAEVKTRLEGMIPAVRASALPASAKYDVLHELQVKESQCDAALIAALQITLNADVTENGTGDPMMAMFRGARPTFQMATPGLAFPVRVHLFQPQEKAITVAKLELVSTSGKQWSTGAAPAVGALKPGEALDTVFSVEVPADEPYTRPYFKRDGLENAFYEVPPSSTESDPTSPYPLEARATLQYAGTMVELASVVQVVREVTGQGKLRFPMPVGPALSVALTPAAGVTPLDAKSTMVSVRVHSNLQGAANPVVRLAVPEGWVVEPAVIRVSLTQPGEEQTVTFTVTPKVKADQRYTVTALAELDGKQYSEGYVTTGYTGLRPYFLYSPATYRTTATDVKMAPGETIAYVEGSGDDVPAALEQIGVHVSYLSAQGLASSDLGKFDAILLGVRAYAARPDLLANNARLLQYVKNGGVLIVQYNTPEYDHNYGPYPYVMSSDPEEVTDEASKVTILDPLKPRLSLAEPHHGERL